MPVIADAALDALLTEVAKGTTIHICSSEPATFTAVSGASLGSAGVTFGAAGDAVGGGRKRTVTPATGATYGASGTASHYAIVGASTLYATGALSAAKAVNAGDTITASAFDIKVNDAVAA
jgi:hypothetical protein